MGAKTKIEWCDMTVNPIIGCETGCPYCFAKRINDTRFRWVEDFSEPKETKTWRKSFRKRELRNIFVGDLCDLFGEWVSDDFICEVFRACEASPQHRYLFLTKNRSRFARLHNKGLLPTLPNMWYGHTFTGIEKNVRGLPCDERINAFYSIEPLHDCPERLLHGIGFMGGAGRWVIIGAESGTTEDKIVPKNKWVSDIVSWCEYAKIPVFMKNSLIPIVGEENMRREFPWN